MVPRVKTTLRTVLGWFGTLLLLIACGISMPVVAQDTGGSFGGGDFGGGGGGGGSDFGGGGGSDFGSGGGSWGGGGSDGWSGTASDAGTAVNLGVGLSSCMGLRGCSSLACPLGIFILLALIRNGSKTFRGIGVPNAATWNQIGQPQQLQNQMDVSAIMIAIDWRARAEVQASLKAIAESGNTGTSAGLATMLHETVVAVRRVELAWLYSGCVNARPAHPSQAEAQFRSVASEMRTRFKKELVRNVGGQTATQNTPEMQAREHEGQGVVVVTIVVAARREIPDISRATDANELKNVMRSFGGLSAADLVALEVIWSPAAENDRMSTAELEQFYPELKKIDESSISGRVFCGYCNAPFAAELPRCPHCGAPASDARRPQT